MNANAHTSAFTDTHASTQAQSTLSHALICYGEFYRRACDRTRRATNLNRRRRACLPYPDQVGIPSLEAHGWRPLGFLCILLQIAARCPG
eukprot:7310436-Pyramimonas_sp.AAC.1